MQVIVNGEKQTLQADCTLAEALQQWGYQNMTIAVAVDNQVILKQNHKTFQLKVGHIIEILMPMQGG